MYGEKDKIMLFLLSILAFLALIVYLFYTILSLFLGKEATLILLTFIGIGGATFIITFMIWQLWKVSHDTILPYIFAIIWGYGIARWFNYTKLCVMLLSAPFTALMNKILGVSGGEK